MKEVEIGSKFGKLTVVDLNRRNGRKAAVCECECGNTINPLAQSLVSDNTKSCGCLLVSKPKMRAIEAGRYRKLVPLLIDKYGFENEEELHEWVDKLGE